MAPISKLFIQSSPLLLQLSLLLLVVTVTNGYPDYQRAIPNGNRVPHPCVKGQAWLGVGHKLPAGGGDRNPFGQDFAAHGLKWTSELCRADSDGDGRSNGQELGDPRCVWREGQTPDHENNISHPGVCEPVTDPDCQQRNNWMKCTPGNFQCDALNDKDLKNMTLRLPAATAVPAEETTYSCMLFRVPADASYHLVATQPLLDNTQVVHHMLLFGCRDGETLKESTSPYRCEMVPHAKCQEVIVTWTIGIKGDCLHSQTGFRLGLQGYRMVALQVHWNNPLKSAQHTDSSGLVIHYTPNLRHYDAGILVFGHLYLQVDPVRQRASGGNSSVAGFQSYSSTCPQHCLREMFNSTIYITTAINHMHYLGKHQVIELMRDGSKVQDLAWDPYFVYDSPVAHRLNPPVAVHPGDEIRTTCTYRRPSSGPPVCYGDATSDEMCFGFLTYFPKEPELLQPWCTSRRSMISCERTIPSLWDRPINGCSWREFIRPPSQEAGDIVRKVLTACYSPSLRCSSQCRAVLDLTRQHACFKDDIGYYILNKLRQIPTRGVMFVDAWFTCNCDMKFDHCETMGEGRNKDKLCRQLSAIIDEDTSGSARAMTLLFVLVTCVCVAGRLGGEGLWWL